MRRSAPVLFCLLALVAAGCSDDKKMLSPSVLPPTPDTPARAVRLVEWCWNFRGVDQYSTVFTDDYRFVFALGDSAGSAYRANPFGRSDELYTSTGVFIGNASHSAAGSLVTTLDQVFTTLPDDRPGKDPNWHKLIRTHADLLASINVGAGPQLVEIHGYAKFYLVRGDSALIPPELVARGYLPDSTRWWIERWEDQTLPVAGALGATTAANGSWGSLKALYR